MMYKSTWSFHFEATVPLESESSETLGSFVLKMKRSIFLFFAAVLLVVTIA